ncbi:MAG: ubiquinone biosynthesis protein UbiA [Bacteroidota bacterium]|nr:ubiquinone biosynthesis protein UbiA [Bacteroidota bacterium]
MMAFLRLIRITNLLIIALSLLLFYYLILVPVHFNSLHTTLVPFTNFEVGLFVLSVVLVAAAGNIINDYFDFQLDKEFKPDRPLAAGKISLDSAVYLHAALAFAGMGIGFYLGWKNNNYRIGYVYIISVLLLYVYSSYLKKLPLVGNLVISMLTAFPFLLLLLFEANFLKTINFEGAAYSLLILIWQVKFYSGFAFITNLAREVVKDIEDKQGDAEYNINTVAVQFGDTTAKIIAAFTFLVLVAGIGYFMKSFLESGAIKEFLYLGIALVMPVVIVLVLLFKAKEQKDYHQVSLCLKGIMLLGILSMPAFYTFHKLMAA